MIPVPSSSLTYDQSAASRKVNKPELFEAPAPT